MQKRLRVAVVGAGIAGCATALMLDRAGHGVTLFEKSACVGRVGAGILLQPSGQNVLSQMGLLDEVSLRAERIEELIAYTHRGRLLSRLAYSDHHSGSFAFGLHRGDLFSVMHRAIERSAVSLRLNHPVHQRSDLDGHYDLIVAADGSRSRMRDLIGGALVKHEYEPAALWAVGKSDAIRGRLYQVTQDTRQLCGLLPMGGGRCSFFWGIQRSDWLRIAAMPFPQWRQTVLDLVPHAGDLLDTMTGFSDFTYARYQAVWMPRVHYGNVVFIGDAAHASSPHLGQGVNLALMDARNLCDAIEASRSVPDALMMFNRRQRWRNAYYSLATAVLTPSFQGAFWPLGPARDLALPLLQRVPPIRSLMLRTLAGTRAAGG